MKLTTQQDRPGLPIIRDLDADLCRAVAHVFREADAAEIVRRVNAHDGLSPVVEAAREALALLNGDDYLSERSERAASARDRLEMALLELDGGAP